MPRIFVNVLVGESAADATSVLATSDQDLVDALIRALVDKLQDPQRQTLLNRLSGAGQNPPS